MRKSNVFLFLLSFLAISSIGQNKKDLEKYLKVFISEKFDKKAPITFEYKPHDYDKLGVVDAFKNALVAQGFRVISETSISTRLEKLEDSEKHDSVKVKKTTLSTTDYVRSRYIITMSFKKNTLLRGQIVDLNNESEIVATFSYLDGFYPEIVAEAVAEKLNRSK